MKRLRGLLCRFRDHSYEVDIVWVHALTLKCQRCGHEKQVPR